METKIGDIPSLIESGELKDQMTIAALFSALHIHGKHTPELALESS